METQVNTFKEDRGSRLKFYRSDLPDKITADPDIAVVPLGYQRHATGSKSLKKIIVQKRILDVLFSSVALILLLPLLPLFAIVIKYSSPGPVFFTQKRKGLDGKPFICYKFRTMDVINPVKTDNGMPNVTRKKDARIFEVGLFMRLNNLDELPQLFNVIKGDMSLTGPRPYMVSECEYWDDIFDDFKDREQIKPGMSGLAQVNGYRGGSLCKKHMRTRLDYDLIYVKSYSIWGDIKIIWRTILQMLRLKTEAH